MKEKICIFAGTRDGRELAELLAGSGLDVTACAATEYGGELLEGSAGDDCELKVRTGRMTEEEMADFFKKEAFTLVIDATHPYAQLVTQNISDASRASGVEYLRLLRAQEEVPVDAVYLKDTAEAVRYLSDTEGHILLTTGSKELSAYSELPGYSERVWARILPIESSLKQAADSGLPAARIIAMQGPFTEEMNEAIIHMTGAKYLVSKMSGKIGGFVEKMDAAGACGIKAIVIGRPPEEEGMSYQEMLHYLASKTNNAYIADQIKVDKVEEKVPCSVETADKMVTEYVFDKENAPEVVIAGIGMGSLGSMTGDVKDAIINAECLVGAGRMLDAAKEVLRIEAAGGKACAEADKPAFKAIAPEKIKECIMEHPEYHRFCVLMSGDTGFFSGTKKLLPMLETAGSKVRGRPGLSSMS